MLWLLLTAFALALVTVISSGCGTPTAVATADDLRDVQYVIELDGLKADQIYDGARLWIAENFRSAKQVIDFEDRSNGIIIGNGVVPNITISAGFVALAQNGSFKMKVEVKDGRARLTFSNFEISGRTWSGMYQSEALQIRQAVSRLGESLAHHLRTRNKSDF